MQENAVAWLALAVSMLLVGFTFARFKYDKRWQTSQDYLTAASRLLEQAVGEFEQATTSDWNGLPRPDRLLWLTVARRIVESSTVAKKITQESHIHLCNHANDFWRGKLRDILTPLNDISLTYFAEDADSILVSSGHQRSSISEKSLKVVIEFMEWPDGKPDPLAGVEPYSDQEIERVRMLRYKKVGDYLEAQNAMQKGSESRQEYWRKQFAADKAARGSK